MAGDRFRSSFAGNLSKNAVYQGKYGAKSIGVWKGESVDSTHSHICSRFAFAFGTLTFFPMIHYALFPSMLP